MQNQKNIDEIVKFLIEKPGYLKKSKYILAERLEDVTLDECEIAIREAKEYLKNNTNTQDEANTFSPNLMCPKCTIELCVCDSETVTIDEPKSTTIKPNANTNNEFNVTKAWQNSKGEWLYSGEYIDKLLQTSTEEIFNKAIDTLKESIKPLKASENDLKSNDKVLMVYTADKHVGALTKSTSHYTNDYNYEVFYSRMKRVYNEILKAFNTYGKFKEIVFVDLGDGLDGMDAKTTRGGHTLPQNMDNKDQFNTYVSVHKILFDNIISSNFASEYRFQLLTNDNHSGDLAYFANSMLKSYLDLKYPSNTKTVLQEKFIDTLKIDGNCFIFSHGKDSEDMKFGFPLHLNDKTELYINKYIMEKNLTGYKCHFIKGDLHQHASSQSTMFRYKNVASIYGSSKWIHTNFGNTKPGFSIEVLDLADNSITEKNITINES